MKNNQEKKSKFRFYAASFLGGLTSGVAGEIFVLWQNKKCNFTNICKPQFRDLCVISGVQQVAKDLSKNVLKRNPFFLKLSKENPLLFGACTGLPMWALTRLVAEPIQNSRNNDFKPFKTLKKTIMNDVTYHTIKNALDEYCNLRVVPAILPNLSSTAAKLAVQGAISGAVGGSAYVLAWPVKSRLTKQTLAEAVNACIKGAPKVGLKKITYTVARPKIGALIE